MNGPFQVAQASGTAASSTNETPVRIYKLTKPLTDQAVMVNLGYDQKVKVDFSAIANEKITLVHVGEKLIILFDNQSTVTVEPVFKSRADGLGDETRDDITVEIAPGRDVSLTEFATRFPISTDISALPAADNDGNSNANAQASGAYFSPFRWTRWSLFPSINWPRRRNWGTLLSRSRRVSPASWAGRVATSSRKTRPRRQDSDEAGLEPSGGWRKLPTAATNGIPAPPEMRCDHATGVGAVRRYALAGQQSLTFALSVSAAGVDSGLIRLSN